MLPAHLIAPAALDGGIVVVQIVELDLHHLDVRIVGEDLLQHLGGVVEGDAHMAHLALRLQPERRLVCMALPEMGIVPRPLRVHQIKVEVFHAAGRQLALKEGPDVRLGLEEVGRQLVRQDVALPGIAAGETLPQRRLALALQIAVGGVEIVEARVQKGVHHLFRLRDVHVLAVHRQPHAAEAAALTVVEGAYACHPALWDSYDLRVFLTVKPDEQLRRIRRRSGPEQAAVFRTCWIPLEEQYFAAFSIPQRCDILLHSETEVQHV